MKTYDSFAPFYDLEYAGKDDDIPFYLELAEATGAPILEIGTGTGRIALPLAEHGFDVWGIDESAQMLKIARSKLSWLNESVKKRLHFFENDMRDFQLNRQFPTIIVPFRAFLHNLTQADQLNTLRALHAHCRPAGRVLIDLFVPYHHLLAQLEWEESFGEEENVEKGTVIEIISRVSHNPVHQLLTIKNTYRETLDDGTVEEHLAEMCYRYIFRYEMELLLKLTGFKLLDVYGDFNQNPYDFFSGEMIFLAEKSLA